MQNRLGNKKTEIIMLSVVAFLFTVLNISHIIYQWIVNPKDRYFTGIAHFFADYFFYISHMSQGAHGAWIYTTLSFTSEPSPQTWIYWFNVTLGHIGYSLGLSPFQTYTVALCMFTFLLIWVWYYFCYRLYPKNQGLRYISFLFILTASNLVNVPLFFSEHTISLLGQFWFAPTEAFNRLGGVPHQLFQTILYIFQMIVFTKLVEEKRKTGFIILTCSLALSIISSSANPIQQLLFVIASFLTAIGLVWKKTIPIRRAVLVLSFTGIPSFIVAFATNIHFDTLPLLVVAKGWEPSQFLRVTLFSFCTAIGAILVFIPFGLPRYLKRGDSLHWIFLWYGLLSLLLFASPIPMLLNTSPVRYLHPAPFALLAVLAAEGLISVSGVLTRLLNKGHLFRTRTIVLVFVGLYILVTLPSLYAQIRNRIVPQRNPLLLMDTLYNHVPLDIVKALKFLDSLKNDKQYPVVLTDNNLPIEVLVPAFTDKISYSGHPVYTLFPDTKESLRKQFFSGSMSSQEAKDFLQHQRIGYLVALNSVTNQSFVKKYSFLTIHYSNPTVLIFKSTYR